MTNIKTELAKREVLRMSNEASNKLTRECLQTALIYLMNEKPFEKITITELVGRSGVSRSAFYRNYSSKEDIILELAQQITDFIALSLKDIKKEDELRPWFHNAFSTIRDNENIFRLLIQANFPQGTSLENLFSLEAVFPSTTSKEHYQNLALGGAFSTVLIHWFQDGMKESNEFMADLCMQLLKSFCI